MRSRRASTLLLLLALAACAVLAAASPALARRTHRHARAHAHARVHPHAFASCARLVGYARSHFSVTHGVPETPVRGLSEPTSIAPNPAPTRAGQAAPPAAAEVASGSGSSYSTTNNQEPGIDEPDLAKTDGKTIFAVRGGTLFAIDVSGSPPSLRVAGSLALGASAYGAELLLRGNRVLVISGSSALPVGIFRAAPPVPSASGTIATRANPGGPIVRASAPAVVAARTHTPNAHSSVAAAPVATIEPSPYYYSASTTVTEVDASDTAHLKVARTLTVGGTFVDARQNGSTARLVIASAPAAISDSALRARPSGWIPRRRFHSFISGHRFTLPVARCSAIRRPAEFSGLGMVSILTINLDRGLYTENATALMADAQIVYGSQSNLYVATQRWINPSIAAGALPSSQETVIDKFDATDRDHTTLVASGSVPGYLLNQFSLSEQGGYLRVASTSAPIWWENGLSGSSQSHVTVLADHRGALTTVGRVSGLGAGQKIYSVRFLGDTAYVVTFRTVDPLYTIDLSSPTAPRVAGTLELAGYSAYLHPVARGLLLGVGQAVGSGNEPSGTQLELFDVSNSSAPRLLARTLLGEGSSSSVQYEHHAFLFWPPTALAVLPVSIYVPRPVPLASGTTVSSTAPEAAGFTGAIGFRISRSAITEVARIAHDPLAGFAPPIERALVVGVRVYTLSSEGVMASDLGTLARLAFVPFPAAGA
jgi:Beta propeller domain